MNQRTGMNQRLVWVGVLSIVCHALALCPTGCGGTVADEPAAAVPAIPIVDGGPGLEMGRGPVPSGSENVGTVSQALTPQYYFGQAGVWTGSGLSQDNDTMAPSSVVCGLQSIAVFAPGPNNSVYMDFNSTTQHYNVHARSPGGQNKIMASWSCLDTSAFGPNPIVENVIGPMIDTQGVPQDTGWPWYTGIHTSMVGMTGGPVNFNWIGGINGGANYYLKTGVTYQGQTYSSGVQLMNIALNTNTCAQGSCKIFHWDSCHLGQAPGSGDGSSFQHCTVDPSYTSDNSWCTFDQGTILNMVGASEEGYANAYINSDNGRPTFYLEDGVGLNASGYNNGGMICLSKNTAQ